MQKDYILDTNILIEDAKSIENLKNGVENRIYITSTTIEELDKLKDKKPQLKGRIFEVLDELEVHKDDVEILYSSAERNFESQDNRIIEEILHNINGLYKPVFVTNDRILQFKAYKKGIVTEEYRTSIPFKQESEEYTGFIEPYTEEKVNNCFYWDQGKLYFHSKGKSEIIDYRHTPWNVEPRNHYQNCLLHLLRDDNIDLVTIQSAAGKGKAQPLYSKVLTPSGFVEMRNLNIDDYVINSNGVPTKINGIFPQGKIDTYEVTFNDGSKTRCCDDHLWTVSLKNSKKWKVKKLSEIKNNLYDYKRERLNWFIPMTNPIEFDRGYTKLPIDPYLLGVIIGDGCTRSGSITISSNDTEIINECNSRIDSSLEIKKIPKKKYDYIISQKNRKISGKKGELTNVIKKDLINLDLFGKMSYEKFIPYIYKFSNINDRIELLKGLFDTDGYIDKNNKCVDFYTSSDKLVKDVEFIVRSLGGKTKIYHKKNIKYEYKVGKNYDNFSRLVATFPENICPFKLKRKSDVYNSTNRYPPSRAIKKIDYIGREYSQCISIESNDSMYITDDFIVTHNTYLSLAAAFYLTFQKNTSENNYEKIYIIKSNYEIGNDLGYLPGTVEEKMYPYFKPVQELIGKLNKNRQIPHKYLDEKNIYGMSKEFVEFLPINYLRGMNLENCIVICEEMQNLSRSDARSLLSRMGENVKCVCTGDIAQIDNPYLTKSNNAMNWMVKLFKGEPNYSHFVLKGKKTRGPICQMVNDKGL